MCSLLRTRGEPALEDPDSFALWGLSPEMAAVLAGSNCSLRLSHISTKHTDELRDIVGDVQLAVGGRHGGRFSDSVHRDLASNKMAAELAGRLGIGGGDLHTEALRVLVGAGTHQARSSTAPQQKAKPRAFFAGHAVPDFRRP